MGAQLKHGGTESSQGETSAYAETIRGRGSSDIETASRADDGSEYDFHAHVHDVPPAPKSPPRAHIMSTDEIELVQV